MNNPHGLYYHNDRNRRQSRKWRGAKFYWAGSSNEPPDFADILNMGNLTRLIRDENGGVLFNYAALSGLIVAGCVLACEGYGCRVGEFWRLVKSLL